MCSCNKPHFFHPTRPVDPDPLKLGPLEPCFGEGVYMNMPALGGMVLVECSGWAPGKAYPPAGLPAPGKAYPPAGLPAPGLPAGGVNWRRPTVEL